MREGGEGRLLSWPQRLLQRTGQAGGRARRVGRLLVREHTDSHKAYLGP